MGDGDSQIHGIRVWGSREDKEELLRLLERDKNVVFRRGIAEIIDPPLIISIVSGTLQALIIIYNFLKKREVEVSISQRDGTVTTIKSTNADKLQVLIDELKKEERADTPDT